MGSRNQNRIWVLCTFLSAFQPFSQATLLPGSGLGHPWEVREGGRNRRSFQGGGEARHLFIFLKNKGLK